MKNKKSTLSFREQYENSCEQRAINEASWFGIVSGFLLIAFGVYQALCLEGLLCIASCLLALTGMLLCISGGFFPKLLEKPAKLTKTAFGFVGRYVLRVLLLPVYFIMTAINLFANRKYAGRFSFVQWKKSCNISSEFSDYKAVKKLSHKYTLFGIISDVLLSLVNIRMFILIPIITVLLILGMLLFFASSNAVFSFVYTLF